MYDEGEGDDDEKALQEALALSMVPEAGDGNQKPAAVAKLAAKK
jgi:hypothetical protein